MQKDGLESVRETEEPDFIDIPVISANRFDLFRFTLPAS